MIEPGSTHGTKRGKSKAAASTTGAAGAGGGGPFSGAGKIRHLKKEDGEPLWRRDIQYDFLRAVFDDESTVFTNNYEKSKIQKQNFADLYIDTMARSSKTSKVLRDKLLSDREAAKGMAMVCLLVNVGRMNTTLNCETLPSCFPSCSSTPPSPASLFVTAVLVKGANCYSVPSLSRDESPAPHIPRHSLPASAPRCHRLQATSGCPETQIDSQGCR